jgi:hypothetical protein
MASRTSPIDKLFYLVNPQKSVSPFVDSFEYTITDGVFYASALGIVKVENKPPNENNFTVNVAKNSYFISFKLVYILLKRCLLI